MAIRSVPIGDAVVDECPDGNAGRELGYAAHVIVVKVRDEQVIDAIDTAPRPLRLRIRRGIATLAPTVSGIDQQGLAGRCDDEGGGSSLDVDEDDLERPRARGAARQQDSQQNRQDDPLHEAPPVYSTSYNVPSIHS